MAATGRLIETRELKTTYLSRILGMSPNIQTFYRYDADLDTAFLLFVDPNRETVSHPVDDYVALFYDPQSLEVVGFSIEAFEHQFLPQQGNRVWRLSETGLIGVDIGFRFGVDAVIPGWDRKALAVTTTSAQQREVDVRVTA